MFPFPSWERKILKWKKLFHGPLNNCQGQTLITWLVLLSLVLLISISFGSALNLIQDRMQVTNICRLESLKTQAEVEPHVKRLFALNPQAKLLRVLMIAAKTRLAVAIAHYNIPMAVLAKKDILNIRKQQQQLDQIQKSLVQTANLKLHSGTFSTYLKLKSTFQEIKSKSVAWAEFNFFLQNPKVPRLAIKPIDKNMAAPYVAWKNFEKQQAIIHAWSIEYKLKGFFKTTHNSQSQCSATLEENSWIPKIRRDKL